MSCLKLELKAYESHNLERKQLSLVSLDLLLKLDEDGEEIERNEIGNDVDNSRGEEENVEDSMLDLLLLFGEDVGDDDKGLCKEEVE
ncbi:hypothetical protein Q3G72_025844 [Acer saccharum]|nr:hypothetical protein Q3G72_025844 [Acer saccharum]